MDWEYSPAPESSAIADIKDRYLPFIDGAFKEGSGEDRDTINPGTGDRLSTVSTVDAADVDRAVKAARRAYQDVWSPMPGRAWQVSLPDRARDRRTVPRAGRRGDPRQRQADQGNPGLRRARRCAALLLSRWLGRQAATSRPGTRRRWGLQARSSPGTFRC